VLLISNAFKPDNILTRDNTRATEDHVKLVMFTDVNDVELYVNPNLVTFIREASDRGFTIINFSDDHSVTVKGAVGDVASKLFNAGKL
jgi:hypothetical protein